MNNKGIIDIVFVVISSIIIVGSVVVGSYISMDKQSSDTQLKEFNYIGDIQTKKAYNKICSKDILPERIRFIKSLEDIEKLSYDYIVNCPK